MTPELKSLYDQKGTIWGKMQDVARRLKEKPDEKLTPEQDVEFNKWDNDLEDLNNKIKVLERSFQIDKDKKIAELQAKDGNVEDPLTPAERTQARPNEQRNVFKKFESGAKLNKREEKVLAEMSEQEASLRQMINFGMDSLSEDESERLSEIRTNIDLQVQKGEKNKEKRAQTVTTTGGGYTIPQGFWADFVMAKKLVSPFFEEAILGASKIAKSIFYWINTTTGNDLPMPTVDDTANVGELLAINTDAFGNTVDLVFGQVIMKAYKYSPKPMKVPNELLQDSGLDLDSLIAEALGTRNGRIQNTHLTTGDNSSKPQGIVAGATSGHVTVGNDALVFADIIDLEHSVDPAYRKSPFARFMLADGILKAIKKIAIGSSDARSLWMPSFRDGAPDTIDGYQYLINQDMQATVADGTKIMLFGDMKQYAIRQAGPPVLRFLGERFADVDQVAWVLFERLDGRYRNTAGIKFLEVS